MSTLTSRLAKVTLLGLLWRSYVLFEDPYVCTALVVDFTLLEYVDRLFTATTIAVTFQDQTSNYIVGTSYIIPHERSVGFVTSNDDI